MVAGQLLGYSCQHNMEKDCRTNGNEKEILKLAHCSLLYEAISHTLKQLICLIEDPHGQGCL